MLDINRRLSAVKSGEIMVAVALILLFSSFLLVNFASGFNLFLYVFVAGAGLLLPLIYPRAGLYAMTWLILVFAKFFTLQPLVIGDIEYKFYLVDIIFVAVVLSLILRLIKGRIRLKFKLVDMILAAWLALVAVYFVLSVTVWDGVFNLSFSSLKNYAFYPLVYFVAYLLLDKAKYWREWLGFVLAGAVGIIGFIVYGLASGRGLWTEITPLTTAGARLLDFDHAWYLSLISIFALVYLLFKKDLVSRMFYILLPIFAVGIIGSLMRHLWVALAVTLVFLYAVISRDKRASFRRVTAGYFVASFAVGLFIVLLVNIFPWSAATRQIKQTANEISGRAVSLTDVSDTSFAWRGAVWQSVWQEYKGNTWRGLGFGQKVFIDMGDYLDYVEVRNIHNSWLAVFVQTGLLGLLLFLCFYLVLFKNLWMSRARDASVAIAKYAVLGVMIFCAAAFLFQPYLEANFFSIFFWLTLGLGRRAYEGTLS
jgi:O-antigen ligase